jgi:CHASE2 domain-containing sensor protein
LWKPLLIAVAFAAALTGITTYLLGALQPLQDAAIGEGFVVGETHQAPANIVIVAVDNATLQSINSQLPIPRSYYARLLDELHQARPKLIGLDLQFIGTSSDPKQDQALLTAFAHDGPVLVTVTDTGSGAGVPKIAGVASPAGVVAASGAIDADSDGVIRMMLHTQIHLDTFAIRAAELIRGQPIEASRLPDNQAWIDFEGPPGTYKNYSMVRVLDGTIPSSAFRGKIVLVGVTAPIAKDVFVTSASPRPMAGVEVQANSIETALRGFPLQSSSAALSIAIILAFALVPVLLSLAAGSLLVAVSSLALAILYLGLVLLAFTQGLVLPAPYPILSLGLATCGVIAVDALMQQRKRLSLENLLKDFLRPAQTAFFISYRRDQGSFIAESVLSALTARFGEGSVFMDTSTINPGQEWPREIQEAILGCSAMLVIVGPYWAESRDPRSGLRRLDDPEDWVRREVEAGLARPEVAVIPVLVDGASMPLDSDLPGGLRSLRERNAYRLTGANFDQEVNELVDGIRRGQLSPLRRAGDPESHRGVEVSLAAHNGA